MCGPSKMAKDENKEDALERLRQVVKQVYPQKFHLAPFGSYVSTFCTEASDLDLVLLLPDYDADERGNAVRQTVVLPTLGNIANKLPFGHFRLKEFIRHARVPILMLQCNKTQVPADMSVNQPYGLLNSWLLRDYAFEPVKHMVNEVKRWTKSKNLNSARDGFLSSYGWTLLTLGYLQDRDHLPAVYLGNATDEISNPYLNSQEALEVAVMAVEDAVKANKDAPRPYLWWEPNAPETLEIDDTLLRDFLAWVSELLAEQTEAIHSRRIVSLRSPGLSPWDDVSKYSPKKDHWSNPVYILIEEPFSGENVGRVLRINGFDGMKMEIQRALAALDEGQTWDQVVSAGAAPGVVSARKRALGPPTTPQPAQRPRMALTPAPPKARGVRFAPVVSPTSPAPTTNMPVPAPVGHPLTPQKPRYTPLAPGAAPMLSTPMRPACHGYQLTPIPHQYRPPAYPVVSAGGTPASRYGPNSAPRYGPNSAPAQYRRFH